MWPAAGTTLFLSEKMGLLKPTEKIIFFSLGERPMRLSVLGLLKSGVGQCRVTVGMKSNFTPGAGTSTVI